MRAKRRPGFEVVLLLVLALLGPPAFAGDAGAIDAAKDAGFVGEQIDGYLGLVRADAGPQEKALVEEVNGKRRRAYEEIARNDGVPTWAVASVTGEKLVSRAPAGHFVRDATGEWRLVAPAR
jgi:uncharacterized protein